MCDIVYRMVGTSNRFVEEISVMYRTSVWWCKRAGACCAIELGSRILAGPSHDPVWFSGKLAIREKPERHLCGAVMEMAFYSVMALRYALSCYCPSPLGLLATNRHATLDYLAASNCMLILDISCRPIACSSQITDTVSPGTVLMEVTISCTA
jgi:hypothetical protein